MTPESLMNSSRSPTKTTTPQSLLRDSTSSASSSFTHITGTNLSVDELLSSCATSDMNPTPDSTLTLTPTSAASSHVSPLVAKEPLPGSSQASKPYENIQEEEEGPKSPPPSPVGGDINDLQGDQLLESSENIAELLQKSARIKEKRMSDSSAEVAQILGANVEEEEEEEEVEDEVIEQDKDDEEEDVERESPQLPWKLRSEMRKRVMLGWRTVHYKESRIQIFFPKRQVMDINPYLPGLPI